MTAEEILQDLASIEASVRSGEQQLALEQIGQLRESLDGGPAPTEGQPPLGGGFR